MFSRCGTVLLILSALAVGSGCRSDRTNRPDGSGKTTIRVDGSDTMVNLAQAWAEDYSKLHPKVSIQVSGGGSGVGIASLTEGVTDLSTSSRRLRQSERERARKFSGKEPVEFVVGLDALAVYVHPRNPLETITLQQLAEIYGENGTITEWSQLGVTVPGCQSGQIIRVSRQNNSGTYHYFREAVLGDQREYKLGSTDQSGSKDVVALVSSTPCAIGYSGMGYHTDQVKMLKIASSPDGPGVAPSVESVKDGSYPIARPLLIYTLGEPQGVLREYLDWIRSPAGQKVVLDLGCIPVPADDAPADSVPAEEAAGEPVEAREDDGPS